MYYVYGMRLRGFSPGCQPMSGLVKRLDDPVTGFPLDRKYHDLLVYNRKLTESEERKYELKFIFTTGEDVL